jgi:hypothetical protein
LRAISTAEIVGEGRLVGSKIAVRVGGGSWVDVGLGRSVDVVRGVGEIGIAVG